MRVTREIKNTREGCGKQLAHLSGTLQAAIKDGTVQSIADNGLTNFGQRSYQIIIDAGKTVGTRGETLIKIVISEDGGMLSAYPVKWRIK